MIDRRTVLKGIAVACACPACGQIAEAAEAGAPHWTYEGHGGPEEWGNLSPAFQSCSIGTQQSPVDLVGTHTATLGDIKIAYQPHGLTVVNNGHTLQVDIRPGSNSIEFEGAKYDLIQFHFHHPSEHLIGGQRSAMELHLVHKGESGALTVLGVMLVPGKASGIFQQILDTMPDKEGKKSASGVTIDMSYMLPAERKYFRYAGSLTTPPCSEVVNWVVFKQPVEVSEGQIKRFAGLFPMNARPPLPLNRRFILDGM